MKLLTFIFTIMFVFLFSVVLAVSNIVYFKNGSIIKCDIIEHVSGGNIKIKTADGSIFVYPSADVVKITANVTSESATSVNNDPNTVTDIDGNVYHTVELGGLIWMKENLRTKRYADGTAIMQGNSAVYSPRYFTFSDDFTKQNGLFYNWAAVVRTDNADSKLTFSGHRQGVCPDGWHVPTEGEFRESFKVTKDFPNRKQWSEYIQQYMIDGNNTTGFSAVKAGVYDQAKRMMNADKAAYFWTTSMVEDGVMVRARMNALAFYCGELNAMNQSILTLWSKGSGASVRCVKNY